MTLYFLLLGSIFITKLVNSSTTKNGKFHGRDSEAESDAFKHAIVEDKRIKEILKEVGEVA